MSELCEGAVYIFQFLKSEIETGKVAYNDKEMTDNLLQPKGDYLQFIVYKKAECIYDITFHFVSRYLSRGDRTIDQMVQAPRSGKQNIIEGSAASTTSRETL